MAEHGIENFPILWIMLRNKNRGYRQLVVWQDAIDLFELNYLILNNKPYFLYKVISNQFASVDSVHRNIAEGYCRKSTRDYLNFLNYSISSLGESVSGMIALRRIKVVTESEFQNWNQLAYKLENGLIKLIDRLKEK